VPGLYINLREKQFFKNGGLKQKPLKRRKNMTDGTKHYEDDFESVNE